MSTIWHVCAECGMPVESEPCAEHAPPEIEEGRLPMNPCCGNRTRHTASIGCCAGCRLLFSSDSAFDRHRRGGRCLTPEDAGLVARPSKTAPGEVIYGLAGSWKPEVMA